MGGGATEGPGIFLPGHEGSLPFFANSASALPSLDLNSVTKIQPGRCWQCLQPHRARLCKSAGNEMRVTNLSGDGETS